MPSADGAAQPSRPSDPFAQGHNSFDDWISQWVPVTLLVNSLNRSLGQNDAYPFALSERALQKLRFVHEVIHAANPAFTVPTPAEAPLRSGNQPLPSDAPGDQPGEGHACASSSEAALAPQAS